MEPQYIRLVLCPPHAEIQNMVLKFLKGEVADQRFFDFLSARRIAHQAVVHIFSVHDDFGFLYFIDGVKERRVNFTVPLKIVPTAGAYALVIRNVSESELRKRLFENPTVLKEHELYEKYADVTAAPPTYLRLDVLYMDSTSTKDSMYKLDSQVPNQLFIHATRPEKMKLDGVKEKYIYSCAWAGCGKPSVLRLKSCSCCKRVRYCAQECQIRDWWFHQHVCKTGRLALTVNGLNRTTHPNDEKLKN